MVRAKEISNKALNLKQSLISHSSCYDYAEINDSVATQSFMKHRHAFFFRFSIIPFKAN